jgi:hypothetical protein
MLKQPKNDKGVMTFAFTTLFWVAVLGWATSYTPTNTQKEACYQAAAKSGRSTDECKSFWEQTTSQPIALFTLVLALSTVGLWSATIIGINNQSKDTRILQRAYISVATRGIEISTKDEVVGQFALVNKGRIPARKVSLVRTAKWDLDGDRSNFNDGLIPPTPNVLPVETELPVGTEAFSRPDYESKKGYLYIWGKITYDDGFGESRWLTFCHRYNCASPRNSQGGIDPKYGRYHHHHNDGD